MQKNIVRWSYNSNFGGYVNVLFPKFELSEIGEQPLWYRIVFDVMNQYLSPTKMDQFCGYLPAMNQS